jgi:hypothetical protein
VIRVSQNSLHGRRPSVQAIHTMSLGDQHVLQSTGVLIEDAGGLNTKMPNDLFAYSG